MKQPPQSWEESEEGDCGEHKAPRFRWTSKRSTGTDPGAVTPRRTFPPRTSMTVTWMRSLITIVSPIRRVRTNMDAPPCHGRKVTRGASGAPGSERYGQPVRAGGLAAVFLEWSLIKTRRLVPAWRDAFLWSEWSLHVGLARLRGTENADEEQGS